MMERGRGSDKVLRSLRKLVVSVPNYATRLMKEDTNKKAMKMKLCILGKKRSVVSVPSARQAWQKENS